VVLVASAGQTSQQGLIRAKALLENVGAEVMGAALNKIEAKALTAPITTTIIITTIETERKKGKLKRDQRRLQKELSNPGIGIRCIRSERE
jgi:hypothetical protein